MPQAGHVPGTGRRTVSYTHLDVYKRQVVSRSDELPQSYVLADSPVDTIYLSELSPAALKRRTETTVADLDSRVLQLPKY